MLLRMPGTVNPFPQRHFSCVNCVLEARTMKSTPIVRRTITQLMVHYFKTPADPGQLATAVIQFYSAILQQLSDLLSRPGSDGVFRRAAALTEPVFPCFQEVKKVEDDAMLIAVGDCLRSQPLDAAKQASTMLLTNFVQILISLIGEQLTWDVLQDACPDIHIIASEETPS